MDSKVRAYLSELLEAANMNVLEQVETTANMPCLACQRARAEGPNVVAKLIDDPLLNFDRELPAEREEAVVHTDSEKCRPERARGDFRVREVASIPIGSALRDADVVPLARARRMSVA